VAFGSLTLSLSALPLAAENRAAQELETRTMELHRAKLELDRAAMMLELNGVGDAMDVYRRIVLELPDAPATEAVREKALAAYANLVHKVSIELAEQGRRDDARELLDEALSARFEPNNTSLLQLRLQIDNPDRFNQAMTPEHGNKVREVTRLLRLAESQELLGLYRHAEESYNQVLLIDPTNNAARNALTALELQLQTHAEAARSQTRATMLRKVDEKWETAPGLAGWQPETEIADEARLFTDERNRTAAIQSRLDNIILDEVRISDATIREAVGYLTALSRQMDDRPVDPTERGVNIILQLGPPGSEFYQQVMERKFNLELRNVPLREAIDYAARSAGLGMRVEPFAVAIVPQAGVPGFLITRQYSVPPDFISTVSTETVNGAAADPFAPAQPQTGRLSLKRLSAREFLETQGIDFPEGAFATFNEINNTLTLRNTPAGHSTLEMLIDHARAATAQQVAITVRMIEIDQRKVGELGFDWLLGDGAVIDGIRYSGGTGADSDFLGDFPARDPDGNPIGRNPLTAGLRSGESAIPGDALSGLLTGAPVGTEGTRRAPGALAVSGSLTQPRFQAIMRALDQSTTESFLSAPTILARSGQQSRIEIIREFIYPTEYDPPQLPGTIGGGSTTLPPGFPGFPGIPGIPGIDLPTPTIFGTTITPATPTAFETSPLGAVLDIEPLLSDDGTIVQLNLESTFRDFIGFVNYGTPITQAVPGSFGNERMVISENRILQPVFETRRINTSVSVYDGHTLTIGGFLEGREVDVHDRVPLLGDLPLLGRFFQSRARESRKKALMIFVTVDVIDSSGQPIRELGLLPGDLQPGQEP